MLIATPAAPTLALDRTAAVAISSLDGLAGAIAHARRVELSAWMLGSDRLVGALEDAAHGRARVDVMLEREPYAPVRADAQALARRNAARARELRAHHVRVHLVESRGAPLHLKAALVDGVAYLDDRNWAEHGAQTIVRSNRKSDVAAVEAALANAAGDAASPKYSAPEGGRGLALRKDRALRLEADLIARAPEGSLVRCASEWLLPGSIVTKALLARAAAGERVEVLVDECNPAAKDARREFAALARLRDAGAEVRVGRTTEKLCIAGDAGWVGSANATPGFLATVDWGLTSRARAIVSALAQRFDRAWDSARQIPRPT